VLRTGSTLIRRNEIQAKWVANQIALKRAVEKTAASKIITFHSRVKLAEEFASDSAHGFSEHVKGFSVFHVNGGQSAASRKVTLEDFKAAGRGLITNARCLTEGVDVPSVDMVAFVDPRKSKIDIAQAAGRAMRQSKATYKKFGYIVVPLFIEQKKNETEAEALARSGFDEVAMVLGAMLENDDDLVDLIREMKEAKGRGDKFNPKSLHEKIEVIGPAIDLDELRRSIDVEIVDRLGMGWDEWYGLLQRFHKREGHCRVAHSNLENGHKLGYWVSKQRNRKGVLSSDQIDRMTKLGFDWKPFDEDWDHQFDALRKYKKREGHCRVPRMHKEDGLKLGIWVNNQKKKKEILLPYQIERLNLLGFSWNFAAEVMEAQFQALEKYKKREGHCRVPLSHKEDGLKLGIWINNVRHHQKDMLSAEQIERLSKLDFSWDPFTEKWEENFSALQIFRIREGHCFVPQNHVECGLRLGIWVSTQRQKKGLLSSKNIERLNQLAFVWNPYADFWEANYSAMIKFKQLFGHCSPKRNHEEHGLKLGRWSDRQRQKKSSLSPDQIERLNALGFVWKA